MSSVAATAAGRPDEPTDRDPASRAGAPAPPEPAPQETDTTVLLMDAPHRRVRHPYDLVLAALSAAAIGVVMVLAVYARGTTRALTSDVQSAAQVASALLTIPITALEATVTLVLPAAVLLWTLVRVGWRRMLVTGATLVAATVIARVVEELLRAHAAPSLSAALAVTAGGLSVVALNGFSAGVAGMLTAAAGRSESRLLRWSWWILVAVLGLAVVRGLMTLPAAIVTILIGRVVGLLARWAAGSSIGHLSGARLAAAVRRAGLDARLLVRADLPADAERQAWRVTGAMPVGHTERAHERPVPVLEDPADDTTDEATDGSTTDGTNRDTPATSSASPSPSPSTSPTTPASLAPPAPQLPRRPVTRAADREDLRLLSQVSVPERRSGRSGVHRLYRAQDGEATAYDVTVLEAERLVADRLLSAWDRLRGSALDRRPTRSVDEALERAALLAHTAAAANVRTPDLLGAARAGGSAVLVFAPIAHGRTFDDIAPEALGDDVLDDAWHQLRRAHRAGLSHLALSASAVVVDADDRVWLRDWYSGDMASSELSRRVDLAQLLALQAVHVGHSRAVDSALRCLTRSEVRALAPLLQPVALPWATRSAARDLKNLLAALRHDLVALVPEANVEQAKLSRFSPRSIVATVVLVLVVLAVATTFNTESVLAAVRNAEPRWIVAAFLAGMLTYLGGGLTLAAFSPTGVGVWAATRAHLAARVVGLVAPAGIGPAAVNLRFLHRKGMRTPLAVATVALVQIAQFVVTILLLVLLALVTGSTGRLGAPGPGVLWALGITAAVLALVAAVRPLRERVWQAVGPRLRQAWPRLTWLAANPGRIFAGVLGVLVMTSAYVLAFGLSLAAFGHALPLVQLTVTYLVANSAGSVVPTPGGIGPVEAALTAGLTLAGVPAASALSAAVVFRLTTFWAPVPLGWLMFRAMQRRGEL